jgi:hypothetical protein
MAKETHLKHLTPEQQASLQQQARVQAAARVHSAWLDYRQAKAALAALDDAEEEKD